MMTRSHMAASYPIPAHTNLALVGALVLFHLLILAALPLLLAQSLVWALLIPVLFWVHSTHWALIHEGIHKILHPTQAVNERLSRLLGILMGTSFHVLRFGHLMHHQLNRDWYSEWVSQRRAVERVRYYGHLLFGLYGTEIATSLLVALLPRQVMMRWVKDTALRNHPDVAVAAERFFYTRGNAAQVRQDMAITLGLYGVAFWHFGVYWPVLLGFLGMRAVVISFLDNIYHYGTPEDNSKAGKELVLPPFYARLLLHANFHETHHLNPDVPWASLPACHNAQGRVFNGRFAVHGLQQFQGPMVRAGMALSSANAGLTPAPAV